MQEGRSLTTTKKRERQDEQYANEAAPAANTFFCMPDVVQRYVSPHLLDWSDHRALACTTASLWRYYQRNDHSTRVMFFMYCNAFASFISRHTQDRLLLESGDLRCIEWLWLRRKRHARAHNVAGNFCLTAARCGHIEVFQRFAPRVEPVYVRSLTRKAFTKTCKYGRDDAAIWLLSHPIGTSFWQVQEWVQFVMLMSGNAHKVPKTFEFLLHVMHVQHNWTERHFLTTCLLNACFLPGYDVSGFAWVWERCLANGMEKRELMTATFNDLMANLEGELFTPNTTQQLGRLPAICRLFFAEFCVTECNENTVCWTLPNNQLSIRVDSLSSDEAEVVFVFRQPNLRMTRALRIPKTCL